MGLSVSKKISTGAIPVWQGSGKDLQNYQGGFKLDLTNLIAGAVLLAGTPMVVDEATRTAVPLRTGKAQANAAANALTYRVEKGSTLKVGDYLAKNAGGPAYAITAIDTSNASYDELTVGTTIAAVTAGDWLYASTATGANASALPACNGLLYEETVVAVGTSVSAVLRGTVYARRVPYNAAIAALAGLKNIIYSQSY